MEIRKTFLEWISWIFKKPFLNKFQQGSLLLEIAIALSVIALISGFFVSKSVTMGRIERESRTKNNIEIVTAALASYLAMHKRLPRPAVFDAFSTSYVSGHRGCESTGCVIGAVPYNTLGISEKNVLDGKGRPLVYAVHPELTDHFDSIYFDQNKMRDLLELPKFFCDSTILSRIKIESFLENSDIVAFVIDTIDNPPKIVGDEGGVIIVRPGPNTFWIRRNFLLIHYLKGCPCDGEVPNDIGP